MPNIKILSESPGILAGFEFRPETATPLKELAEVLLRGPSTLSRGERELIATFVSALNGCEFCRDSHRAFAEKELGPEASMVEAAISAALQGPGVLKADERFSRKLRALIDIAAAVNLNMGTIIGSICEFAREVGATDVEIHDTILIASAFAMYNRYVEGLGTGPAKDSEAYRRIAEHITTKGYR